MLTLFSLGNHALDKALFFSHKKTSNTELTVWISPDPKGIYASYFKSKICISTIR